MHCRRGQGTWLLVAWAALVAQAAPWACCGACDRACCEAQSDRCGPAAAEANDATPRCPLCAAAAAAPKTDSDGHPCRCHLDAREVQFVVPAQGPFRVHTENNAPVAPAIASPNVPPALGASREYLAASLAVPIRPPRILFGVWRN